MGAGIDKLTDRGIQAFIKTSRPGQKLADGGGLYVFKTKAGSGTFRVDYRIRGPGIKGVKGQTYSVGVFPEVTLKDARAARAWVRAHLRAGRDPMVERRVDRLTVATSTEQTFGAMTDLWLAKMRPEWRAAHYDKSRAALERDVLPALAQVPVAAITTPMLTAVIERIAARGAVETAARILQHVVGVMDLAKTRGANFAENPASAVKAAIQRRPAATNHPALHDLTDLGDVLRRFEASPASDVVKMAHRLIAFTAARVGNVTDATWDQFHLDDDDDPRWVIPRASMKIQRGRTHDHVIYLGPSITTALGEWQGRTGDTGLLFASPSGNGRPISRESLEKCYRTTLALRGQHTLHGWRSSFATMLKERGFARDVVELSLDHVADSAVVRAYDRGERLAERVRVMRWWDSELSAAERGTPTDTDGVLPMRPARGAA